ASPHINVERIPINLTQTLQGGASAGRIAASGREDDRPMCRDEDGLAPCITRRRGSGIFGVRSTGPHDNQSKGTRRKRKYCVAGSSPCSRLPEACRSMKFRTGARDSRCEIQNSLTVLEVCRD